MFYNNAAYTDPCQKLAVGHVGCPVPHCNLGAALSEGPARRNCCCFSLGRSRTWAACRCSLEWVVMHWGSLPLRSAEWLISWVLFARVVRALGLLVPAPWAGPALGLLAGVSELVVMHWGAPCRCASVNGLYTGAPCCCSVGGSCTGAGCRCSLVVRTLGLLAAAI